jgi:hypothetical protein
VILILLRCSLLAVATLCASSCQIGLAIRVYGPATAPIFQIEEQGSSAENPPHFGDLSVVLPRNGEFSVTWAVDKQQACEPAVGRVVYGRTPPGFAVSTPPVKLNEGETYGVSAGGCGRIGGANFKIVNGQVVQT